MYLVHKDKVVILFMKYECKLKKKCASLSSHILKTRLSLYDGVLSVASVKDQNQAFLHK